jgi:uncharacterized protein (TIGR03790 family)
MKTMRTFFLCLIFAGAARAQSPENVLLILNESSPVSLEVGQYYAQKRGIPEQNVLRVKTAQTDEISREDFSRQIENPIAVWLNKNAAQDRILYFVLTKGMPLRVQGTSGASGTVASVDSELTLLYRKLTRVQVALPGPTNNPYFLGENPVNRAVQFTHQGFDIYLVARLDGYTSADIRGLIDRGFSPKKDGKILLDQKGSPNDKGDKWLQATADWMNVNGFSDRVVIDTSAAVLKDETGVLGYYSWGSNAPAIKIRHFNLGFVPGALAGMFVSSDGRTFTEPSADWKIGTWEDRKTYFSNSPQSLAGDLIRDGITGIAAHVAEPYLEATIRPNILFPAYLSGFNLVESYYLAMPYLSWQTVVVGDPLCAPFRTNSLSALRIEKGTDPDTGLPGFFSDRLVRLALTSQAGSSALDEDMIKQLLRAQVLVSKEDLAGARQVLETATARNDKIASAQLILGTVYDQLKDYDKAIERYRKVVELESKNVLALNNLAYDLAVRKNSPQEALPMAELAYSIVKTDVSIGDTLAWIYHLTGKNDQAKSMLEPIALRAPQNAEIHLHLAVVSAETGQILQASRELALALEIDPKLDGTDDVVHVRALIKTPFGDSLSTLSL